jgi:hypothetical protein
MGWGGWLEWRYSKGFLISVRSAGYAEGFWVLLCWGGYTESFCILRVRLNVRTLVHELFHNFIE